MYIKSKLIKQLKSYKKRNRYSVRELAKEIGVGQSWLNAFIKNMYEEPSIKRMTKVHDYLIRKDK